MKKFIFFVILIVIAGLAWLLVKDTKVPVATETATPQASTLVIGVVVPITGDATAYGIPNRNLYQMAADEINSAGGIDGKQISLVIKDSKCDGPTASASAQELITQNKVQVILGDFCSGGALAMTPVAEAAKVALFSGSASSPKLTGISPYFFRDYPSDASQGKVLAEVAYNTKHWKKVAFAQEQTDYAKGVYDAFSSNFQSLGGTVMKQEFPSTGADIKKLVASLKTQKADALFIDVQTPAMGEKVLKEMQAISWKPSLMVSDTIPGDPTTVQNNKTALEGALAAEFRVDPANTKFQTLLTAYKIRYGIDLPYQGYGATEYDQLYMLKDAINAVGYTGDAIATWFHSVTNWDGSSGTITIQSNGDRNGGHTAEVIKNGKVELF